MIVSAIVTITQHFWQYSPDRLERAKYVFPIPARSAICGFKMTAPDGTIVTAIAKEKEEAKREHETAITQGYMTGLVEHVTDDSELVFFLLCTRAYRDMFRSLLDLSWSSSRTADGPDSNYCRPRVLCDHHSRLI